MTPEAAERERTIPHLAGTLDAPEPPAPRLLIAEDTWRVVRVVKVGGEVVDVLEVPDGVDALGGVRWTMVGTRDGVSTYMRVIAALLDRITKGLE